MVAMMRGRPLGTNMAAAAALDVWADSRERAVASLSRHAAILADHGCGTDAEHFTFAARFLTVTAVRERAQAAALRAAAATQATA